MNVKLLRKVAKHILAEPKRWSFFWRIYSHESPCGTMACIGGWTQILGDPEGKLRKPADRDSDHAARLLGIDRNDEGIRLFFYWPEKFRKKRLASRSQKQEAKVAAARIEFFIKTKGTDKL